jgi:hypothetical protein
VKSRTSTSIRLIANPTLALRWRIAMPKTAIGAVLSSAAAAIVLAHQPDSSGARVTLFLKDSTKHAREAEVPLKTALVVLRPQLKGASLERAGKRHSIAFAGLVLSNMDVGCDAYRGDRPLGGAKPLTEDDIIVNVRVLDEYPRGADWTTGSLGKVFAEGSERARAEFRNYHVAVQHRGAKPKPIETNVAFGDPGAAITMQHLRLAPQSPFRIEPDSVTPDRPTLTLERDSNGVRAVLAAAGEELIVKGQVSLTVCPAEPK